FAPLRLRQERVEGRSSRPRSLENTLVKGGKLQGMLAGQLNEIGIRRVLISGNDRHLGRGQIALKERGLLPRGQALENESGVPVAGPIGRTHAHPKKTE